MRQTGFLRAPTEHIHRAIHLSVSASSLERSSDTLSRLSSIPTWGHSIDSTVSVSSIWHRNELKSLYHQTVLFVLWTASSLAFRTHPFTCSHLTFNAPILRVFMFDEIDKPLLKCNSWQPRWTLITLSEMGQMEILPQTVESNLSLYPFTREGHQTPSPSSTTLYCTAMSRELPYTSNSLFFTMLFSHVKRHSSISDPYVYIFSQVLTLSSGMWNLQQEARLVLAMVRLSFSTLVKLVLSRGTEIKHKSVMTPSASHGDLQSKSFPKEQAFGIK